MNSMGNLHENAMLILRYMLDEGLVKPNNKSPQEIQIALGLSDAEYDNAENFVLQANFVGGGGGGKFDALRWLEPQGVQYIKNELREREPISLDAEKSSDFWYKKSKIMIF